MYHLHNYTGVKSPQATVEFLTSRNTTGLFLVEIDEPIDEYRYLVEYNSKTITFQGNQQIVEANCMRNISVLFTISASNECGRRSENITIDVECECKLVHGNY